MTRLSSRGSSILQIIIASVIAGTGFLYFGRSILSSRKQSLNLHEAVVAESYATELLEFFRSHSDTELKKYLEKNPITGSAATKKLYKLCAHINILDRKGNKLLNEDPIAALPLNSLDGITPDTRANRWYQVQVANITGDAAKDEIKIRKDLCAATAKEISFNGQPKAAFLLTNDEKFLVTVGLSWYGKGKNPEEKELKRVVLTTVLPDNHP